MLKNKNILLGISGSIAAYKTPELIRLLKKQGASVKAVLTANASHFAGPGALATVSDNPVYSDMFARSPDTAVEHIVLAEWAQALVVAPATANIIGKFANGVADDYLSTLYLSMDGPVILAPAMNPRMFHHPATQENIRKLRERGVCFTGPCEGDLACGEKGLGRMSEPVSIVDAVITTLMPKPLAGKKVLVTAGGTRERIDAARCLTNYSSGKMGHALARAAAYLGAGVTLVNAAKTADVPDSVKVVSVESALDMFETVKAFFPETDMVLMAAAVADHRPARVSREKIKKADLSALRLVQNPDILEYLGKNKKPSQFILGFAVETRDALSAAHRKLLRKKCDLIALNNPNMQGSGFGEDTNIITLVDARRNTLPFPKMPKTDAALKIIDRILAFRKNGRLAKPGKK